MPKVSWPMQSTLGFIRSWPRCVLQNQAHVVFACAWLARRTGVHCPNLRQLFAQKHPNLPQDPQGFRIVRCDNTLAVSLRHLVRESGGAAAKQRFLPNPIHLVKTKRPGSGGSRSADVQHLPRLGLENHSWIMPMTELLAHEA